jgi:hypothetical protein
MRYPNTSKVARLRTSLMLAAAVCFCGSHERAFGQTVPAITLSPLVPAELNPPFVAGPPSTGGAPAATPEQASAFAWQEFIALNWPAGPQDGRPDQREAPSKSCRFGDPSPDCNLLVWETFRGKVEIFPGGINPPPGYAGSTQADSWGYDALPAYDYGVSVAACDVKQAKDTTPWVNLDETDQITLDNMYAGVVKPESSPGNTAPQLIRFLAKANRSQYVYVTDNSDPNDPFAQWWSAIPPDVVSDTKAYLAQNQSSPPAGSKTLVSLPDGTIEAKAGWRPLNRSEIASRRFHMQTVRFYEGPQTAPCYRDATWGLVALHIIQKTPSAPYFIYATFEQAENILDSRGRPIEDADGKIVASPEPATQVCLVDPVPSPPKMGQEAPSVSGSVILTADPATCQPLPNASYCGAPGSQLYYRNKTFPPPNNQPSEGNICVDKRDNAIPDYVIEANHRAHEAIASYLTQNNIRNSPWLAYKLVNVQYFPYDKIPDPKAPNGSPYTASPPFTATNPAPSSYYQANIVVETNRSLQLFAGGLSPNISTEWNQDGSPHKNSYYGGHFYNMGGCMGCHGSQGQNPAGMAGDFSVILARGAVMQPEVPALATSQGLESVRRNRKLSP